jgi:hypothetical protein
MPRAAFNAWTVSPNGQAAVARVASDIRFALFGKAHTARRRLWRGLLSGVRDTRVAAAIEAEVDTYLRRLGQLAYADGLPRVTVELRRLVVIPHALLNGAAYHSLSLKAGALPALAAIEQSAALRDLLFLTVVHECSDGVARLKPSPKRPLSAGAGWTSVGVNHSFVWRDFYNAPTWPGHHYVLEVTREPITRRVRKAAADAIAALETELSTLSVVERLEILRRASAVPCA